jgi:hypothetical protein
LGALTHDEVHDHFLEATPKPFKRTGSGIYYVDKDGLEILVHEYDLVVTDIAYDTFTGYEVATVKHFLPNDGWQRFRFRSSDVGSDKDFERAFRDNHVKPHKPQLLRLYVSHYLQQLQRARRMAKLYGSMGWKDGTNEFVLGTKVFRRDGTVEAVGLSDNVSGSIKGFGSKGELAPWVEQTTLFDSPRLEAHAFSACVWTGAPLMKFTGLQAALFVMVGKTNGGKSSMADFCLSAYGDFRKLQMREDDTETNDGSVDAQEAVAERGRRLGDRPRAVPRPGRGGRHRDVGVRGPAHRVARRARVLRHHGAYAHGNHVARRGALPRK